MEKDKIEVGEYIRTNLGHIGKIIKEYTFENEGVVYPEPQEWVLDNKYVLNEAEMYQTGEQIIKHSKNIIDLIEVGDYVNGVRILDVTGDYIHTTEWDCCKARLENKLHSIVTKEQMKEMEYRV